MGPTHTVSHLLSLCPTIQFIILIYFQYLSILPFPWISVARFQNYIRLVITHLFITPVAENIQPVIFLLGGLCITYTQTGTAYKLQPDRGLCLFHFCAAKWKGIVCLSFLLSALVNTNIYLLFLLSKCAKEITQRTCVVEGHHVETWWSILSQRYGCLLPTNGPEMTQSPAHVNRPENLSFQITHQLLRKHKPGPCLTCLFSVTLYGLEADVFT